MLIASERAAAKSSRLQRSAESQRTEWFEEKWPDACSYHHLTSLCASSGGMQQSGMWNVEIWGRGVAKWAATPSQKWRAALQRGQRRSTRSSSRHRDWDWTPEYIGASDGD